MGKAEIIHVSRSQYSFRMISHSYRKTFQLKYISLQISIIHQQGDYKLFFFFFLRVKKKIFLGDLSSAIVCFLQRQKEMPMSSATFWYSLTVSPLGRLYRHWIRHVGGYIPACLPSCPFMGLLDMSMSNPSFTLLILSLSMNTCGNKLQKLCERKEEKILFFIFLFSKKMSW